MHNKRALSYIFIFLVTLILNLFSFQNIIIAEMPESELNSETVLNNALEDNEVEEYIVNEEEVLLDEQNLNLSLSENSSLEANEIMVSDFNELRNILTNSSYNYIDTIYLEGDIVKTSSTFTINANRSNLTIVGHPKGSMEKYTITDNSAGAGGFFNAYRSNITIKDAIIDSYNYYGPFYMRNDTTLEFINVDYSGPQLSYNLYGLTRIIDSNILLESKSGSNPLNEVMEGNRIEIGGNTTITIEGYTGSHAFYFTGTRVNRYFKVLENSNFIFINNNTYSLSSDFLFNGVDLIVENGAYASIQCNNGITAYGSNIDNITIGEKATLKVNQTGSHDSVINLRYSINVKQGGTFEVINDGTSDIIHFLANSSSIIVDNPKRVLFYSPNSTWMFYYSGKILGKVEAINSWNKDNTSSYLDDSISNLPSNIWNKNNGALMDFSIDVYLGRTSYGVINNVSAGDPFTAPFSSDSFNVDNMGMFVMGDYELSVNEVMENSTRIKGKQHQDLLLSLSIKIVE